MLFGIQYRKEDGRLFELDFSVDAETEEAGWKAAEEEAKRLTKETGIEHTADGMIVWREEVPDEHIEFYKEMMKKGKTGLN